MRDIVFLAIIGFVTGMIDAIVGGGGLISVPSYMLVLGAGVSAIATNKVSAFVSTMVAFSIYKKNGFVHFRKYKLFFIAVFIGAIIGAQVSQLMPQYFYKYMMVFLLPLMLAALFTKNLWVEKPNPGISSVALAGLGFLCGLYDGVAGPGGGTLMFLALFVAAGMPLTASIGTAKLANVFSSGASLATYAFLGEVNWVVALPATLTISAGALIGASYATKNASYYARGALVVVSLLLLVRLIMTNQ